MNRTEVWLLLVSTFVLSATGLIYAAMHYLMKPADPFSVVNHPWEPYMIAAHIVVAPVLVLAVGLIVHSHILWKLENGVRIARRSGIFLMPLFVLMVVSGYLLQVITGNGRAILVWVHLISGTLWFVSFAVHQIASIRFRRSLSAQNPLQRNRVQV